MANIDPNAWYQVIESRVDYNSSLQSIGDTLLFAAKLKSGDGGQYWQFQPAGNGYWNIRNIASSIKKQLSTCKVDSEIDDSKHNHACNHLQAKLRSYGKSIHGEIV
jgi:hypothetical protein